MNPDNSHKNTWQYVVNWTVLSILGKVGCLTVLIATGSLLIGMLLDHRFGTHPWLKIFFVALSFPVSSLVIYLFVRASTAHLTAKPKEGTPRE